VVVLKENVEPPQNVSTVRYSIRRSNKLAVSGNLRLRIKTMLVASAAGVY